MIFLRQSTASQEVPLGPFVDSTDGNTQETGLSIANTDIKLWVSGATTLANKNSGGATHISNGIYYTVLDATDTATLGPLTIHCHPSGSLAFRMACVVLKANIYDALVTNGAFARGDFASGFFQEIAKIVYPFEDTIFVRGDGSNGNDGLSPSTAKATIAGGLAIADADDGIIIAAGDHTIATAGIDVPHKVHLRAPLGGNIARVTSDANLNVNGCMIKPGNYSDVFGLCGISSGVGGTHYSAFIGAYEALSDKAFTRATMRSCTFFGDSDCVFVDHSSEVTLLVDNCTMNTNYDAVAVFQAISTSPAVDVRNSVINIVGPSGVTSWNGYCRGTTCEDGIVVLTNTQINVSGGTSRNVGLYMSDDVGGETGLMIMRGGAIRTSGTGASPIRLTGTNAHAIVEQGVSRLQQQTVSGSGTLTTYPVPSQVKGLDASVVTASALASDAATEVATAVGAATIDGSITRLQKEKVDLSVMRGALTVTDNGDGTSTCVFKDDSGATILTLTASNTTGARTAKGTVA